MTSHVRLYFPSTDRHGDKIVARLAHLVTLEAHLCEDVGGYTTYPARGGYRMASGADMHESVDVVEFFSTPAYARSVASQLASQLNQESVLVLIDGRPEFISQAAEAAAASM